MDAITRKLVCVNYPDWVIPLPPILWAQICEMKLVKIARLSQS